MTGSKFEEKLLADPGWAVFGIALPIGAGLIMSRNRLSNRIPVELVEKDCRNLESI